ncbi:MAG TPA: ABC transporter substrate-binding protein [Mycobacteriales bacterium]|nr:ABC transporter substrate-binding protein [Mycobacteriales bacterium]
MRSPRRIAGVTGIVALLALAAGCGGSSSGGQTEKLKTGGRPAAVVPSLDPAVVSQLPAKIKSKGELTVAADASYAPNEFKDANGNVIGMDPDLAQALGKVMGLKLKVVNAGFDSIIPGLKAGRYDLGMSSFTDTKEREKVVDFVTYFSAGTSFFVQSNGGPDIQSLADLCGHKVSVESGTTQEIDAKKQSKQCTSSGKPAVNVLVFGDQSEANLALASGRADVSMADSPVAAYQVKQSNGKFKLSGQPYGSAPYGIAIPKNNGMAQPILAALKDLMSSGVYKQILTKWGIQAGAISNPQINGATS